MLRRSVNGILLIALFLSASNTRFFFQAYANDANGPNTVIADILVQPAQLWRVERSEKLQLLEKLRRFIRNVFKAEVTQQKKRRLEEAAARQVTQLRQTLYKTVPDVVPAKTPYTLNPSENQVRFRQRMLPFQLSPVPNSLTPVSSPANAAPNTLMPAPFNAEPDTQSLMNFFPQQLQQVTASPPVQSTSNQLPLNPSPEEITYNKAGAFLDSLQPPAQRRIAERVTNAVLSGQVPLSSILAFQDKTGNLAQPAFTADTIPNTTQDTVSNPTDAPITPIDPMQPTSQTSFQSAAQPRLAEIKQRLYTLPNGPLSLLAGA